MKTSPLVFIQQFGVSDVIFGGFNFKGFREGGLSRISTEIRLTQEGILSSKELIELHFSKLILLFK